MRVRCVIRGVVEVRGLMFLRGVSFNVFLRKMFGLELNEIVSLMFATLRCINVGGCLNSDE